MCRQCVRDLPSASYHHATGYKDGLTGKCKECCIAAISQRAADRDLESVRRSSEGSNVTRQPEGADVDSCIAVCTSSGVVMAGFMARVILLFKARMGDYISLLYPRSVYCTLNQSFVP